MCKKIPKQQTNNQQPQTRHQKPQKHYLYFFVSTNA